MLLAIMQDDDQSKIYLKIFRLIELAAVRGLLEKRSSRGERVPRTGKLHIQTGTRLR
jgi:hypothetical protein